MWVHQRRRDAGTAPVGESRAARVTAAWPVLLALLVVTAGACDRRSHASDVIVDRAYDVYQAVSDAFDATPDCSAAVAAALCEVDARRGDLEAAFALQADSERLAAARPALESRLDRFQNISAALEAAFGRCSGTPDLDRLQEALDR